MNIAIIGYGNMGKLIETRAQERGHRVTAVIDPHAPEPRTRGGLSILRALPDGGVEGADLAFEFTRPATALENIRALLRRKLPAVVGTTGWYDSLSEVEALAAETGSSLLWAPNFSLGVNLLYRIAAFAAKLADPFPEYDIGGWEAHHNRKQDSPSGTAKILVERVLAQMTRKKRAVYDALDRPPRPEELHFASLRAGAIPGVHTVLLDSPADTIEITHTARNRDGLAFGAIRAAEWLASCPGPGQPAGAVRQGVFTLEDVLKDVWQGI
jgi:4-hydroxy-tetrahydrodipicolinate reductase